MVSGAGPKALCAGGDVAALALQNEEGPEGQQKSSDFFGLEFRIDHLIAGYSKPYVSIMDGITMGGGVGLSVHAPFRIATEKTLFAMPETNIGYFPDVGGSFFLSRLDGQVGTYLALTSERLKGVQAFYSGIATHYIDSSVLGNLTQRLSELTFKDYASLQERMDLVNSTIAEFSTGLPSLQEEGILLGGDLRNAIDRCFQYNTVEEIFEALKNETEQKEWAEKTLATLSNRSPTSLKVALRATRLGEKWTIDETFQREHQISAHFMRHPDFVEGVKALLLTKPSRQAQWQPATLEEVTDEYVDSFFALPEGESRMELFCDANFAEYPHAKYALPSEKEIEYYIRQNTPTKEHMVKDFVAKWGWKEGVRNKVIEVLTRRTAVTEGGQLQWL